MPHPDYDELVDLVVEPAPGSPVEAHVRHCTVCGAEIDALRQTMSMVRDAGYDSVSWQAPSADLWSRIEDEIDRPAVDSPVQRPELRVLPPAVDVDPTPVDVEPTPMRRRPAARAASAMAAAAGLAVGLLGGYAVRGLGDDPAAEQSGTQIAAAQLGPLTGPASDLGSAQVVRQANGLDLRVSVQQQALGSADTGYREVWLINTDGKRMVSIGVLPPLGSDSSADAATFPIDQALLDAGYVIVDVSQEAFDNDATHSGDSLVRGTLEA